jgi:hypothetical protein
MSPDAGWSTSDRSGGVCPSSAVTGCSTNGNWGMSFTPIARWKAASTLSATAFAPSSFICAAKP